MIILRLISVLCIWELFASAELEGPKSINDLLARVYGNVEKAPTFVSLSKSPHIAVANNETASLKVWDLEISHYPLKKGRVTFLLDNLLTQEIPENSKMELVSFVGDEVLFNGTVSVCDYLIFAQLHCPVKSDDARKVTKHVLQVPEQAGDGRLSFLTTVTQPDGSLVVQVAGMVDLVNDGTDAEEIPEPIIHDEL